MGNNYFKCVVAVSRTQEDATEKKVKETYLVEALSHTEAEARITEELIPYTSGDLEVHAITRANLSDVLDAGGDLFFQYTVAFATIDEKTEKEKITKQRLLIRADDFDASLSHFNKEARQWLAPYVIAEIKQTNFLDFFPFKS